MDEQLKEWFNNTPHDMGKKEFDSLSAIVNKELEAYQEVVEAAEKLAEVKHHKDHKGKDDWYKIHQPAAWVRLFEALRKLNTEEVGSEI